MAHVRGRDLRRQRGLRAAVFFPLAPFFWNGDTLQAVEIGGSCLKELLEVYSDLQAPDAPEWILRVVRSWACLLRTSPEAKCLHDFTGSEGSALTYFIRTSKSGG